MTAHLSPLDSMFLELEQADEGAHMHIGAALVFDPPPDGRIPRIADLRAHVAAGLPLLPRFSQRLSSPRTRSLSWLTWEPVPEVDVPAHVHHARLPSPGVETELLDWLAEFWSHRLDRTRPLWEVTLLDGLRGHRWALATKTHHCLVDGVGGLDIGALLLDADPDAPPPTAPGEPAAPGEPDDHGGGRFWLQPGLLVRGAGSSLRHPVETLGRAAAMADMLVREEVIAAPRTSINRPLSGARAYAVARFALADIKEIRRSLGGTVNDVVLAMCAGALRRLLLARGERPPKRGLRAQVPVNIRAADQEHALGNRLTSLYVELPVAEPDALKRVQMVREREEALKGGTHAVGGKATVDLASAMPPAFGAAVTRALYGHDRMFNLTITNVPGPQQQLYAMGSRLREILPLVPLFAGHTIGIAIFSYAGEVVFGLNADRLAVPDLPVLADGLEAAFEELRPSVHRSARRTTLDV